MARLRRLRRDRYERLARLEPTARFCVLSRLSLALHLPLVGRPSGSSVGWGPLFGTRGLRQWLHFCSERRQFQLLQPRRGTASPGPWWRHGRSIMLPVLPASWSRLLVTVQSLSHHEAFIIPRGFHNRIRTCKRYLVSSNFSSL